MTPDDSERLDTYLSGTRARVPEFAARHFGLPGTLRLHRRALGLDLVRSPLNVLLVGPAFFVRLAALTCRSLGLHRPARWLATRRLFVETDIARALAELVMVELLAVPEAAGERPGSPAARGESLLAEYVSARHAVAELAAGLVALVVGLLALGSITPSALTLGPTLAREYAQAEAVAGFWLGPWAGAIYHTWWPAAASWTELVVITLAVIGLFAVAATFMGILTDPLQQAAGLHARRLHRLIDTVERVARGEPEARLGLPDPYIARLADLADGVNIALRLLR